MKVLTEKDFKESTKSGVVVVDLFADWCGPCRALTPILEELDGKIDGVTFTKLDVDSAPGISSEFGIMSIPTVLILKDGVEVKRITGLFPKATYIDAFSAAVKS